MRSIQRSEHKAWVLFILNQALSSYQKLGNVQRLQVRSLKNQKAYNATSSRIFIFWLKDKRDDIKSDDSRPVFQPRFASLLFLFQKPQQLAFIIGQRDFFFMFYCSDGQSSWLQRCEI